MEKKKKHPKPKAPPATIPPPVRTGPKLLPYVEPKVLWDSATRKLEKQKEAEALRAERYPKRAAALEKMDEELKKVYHEDKDIIDEEKRTDDKREDLRVKWESLFRKPEKPVSMPKLSKEEKIEKREEEDALRRYRKKLVREMVQEEIKSGADITIPTSQEKYEEFEAEILGLEDYDEDELNEKDDREGKEALLNERKNILKSLINKNTKIPLKIRKERWNKILELEKQQDKKTFTKTLKDMIKKLDPNRKTAYQKFLEKIKR